MDREHSACSVDWTRCIFCQKVTREKTLCPGLSKKNDSGLGYKTLSDNVSGFQELGAIPTGFNVHLWDEGDGIESTCRRNSAFWHPSCRIRLHSTTLERMRKRPHVQVKDQEQPHSFAGEYEIPESVPRLTRSTSGFVETAFSSVCFFCEVEGKDNRRTVMTEPVNERVRQCAQVIQDPHLLAKLAQGDLIAIEAQYHPACLLGLYDKASKAEKSIPHEDDDAYHSQINAESLALADVIAYVEELRMNANIPAVFYLSKLVELYTAQLQLHGVKAFTKIHSTRFKDRLLTNCPDLIAVEHGKEVLLTFNDSLGFALHKFKENSDGDAVLLMRTAKLIRNEMFRNDSNFNGLFHETSQQDSVPSILLSLIGMLLEGPGNFEVNDNQAALTIAQLIIFNAVKRPRRTMTSAACQKTTFVRHALNQETPIPIYVGMMLHSATRKKKLVDKCNRLGLSVSYDRVNQIATKLGNSVCEMYNSEQLVCPPVLRGGLFTVAAVDNIDHNPSSTTAKSSFHGTAISLMQFPNVGNPGVDRHISHSLDQVSSVSSEIVLPLVYSEVPPCLFPKQHPHIPPVMCQLSEASNNITYEYDWLNKVMDCVDNKFDPVNITWAGHHAHVSMQESQPMPIIAMLPIFRHSANTVAMIRHSLTVVRNAVYNMNPVQVPVVTFDQPLYAIAKQIQWHWPQIYGEEHFVVMMGGLHIEMASLKMLGKWMDGSGWVQCLVNAGVATSGVADAFIGASHVKRTRYAHTVTAAALYISQQRAYSKYCDDLPESIRSSYVQWCSDKGNSSVQFLYWNTVLELELIILTFVRSVREGNFELYVESLRNLAPWFFCLDHTNYARWLSVHLRDMLNLEITHPNIAVEFKKSKFTVSKSNKHFSNISIDHAHEQLNALIKGDGGGVGLTESDAGLTRWITASPEILRVMEEFEGSLSQVSNDRKHHEQKPCCQKRFQQDVKNLLEVFDQEGCPFSETTANDFLISLDSHTVADDTVSSSVRISHNLGSKQLETFFRERLQGTVSIHDPIHKNKLPLFTFKSAAKNKSASRLKVAELKMDCQLFSHLYIACQSRESDLNEFFRHENQACPPSLSQRGSLRFGTKSDLLTCLSTLSNPTKDISELDVECCILDGAVIVQMLNPGGSRNFEEYIRTIFLPYIHSVLSNVLRLDIVFDRYLPNSLKYTAREKRGSGTRTHVVASTKIPRNWHEFLRVDANKTELFHILADAASKSMHHGKQILVTYDDHVLCNRQMDISSIDPCNHEEADMRLILHCTHASVNGMKRIAIRTVDTDVVVLAVSFFNRLSISELWIHFGVGRAVRLIAVHELTEALGPDKSLVLPVFHSLTGCDTTSSFCGKGKKSAWEAWSSYPLATEAFFNLNDDEDCLAEATISVLERFLIVMYDRTSDCTSLDAARMQMFTKKAKSLESLPPTSDAFLLHVKRTIFQAVHCWGHCMEKEPHFPDPTEWGWTQAGEGWVPKWMTLPEVSQSCSELIHCGCKKGCFGKCKCVRSHLVCTALCQCGGGGDKCVRK